MFQRSLPMLSHTFIFFLLCVIQFALRLQMSDCCWTLCRLYRLLIYFFWRFSLPFLYYTKRQKKFVSIVLRTWEGCNAFSLQEVLAAITLEPSPSNYVAIRCHFYRGADKSLAQQGRKQANVSLRLAPCLAGKKKLDDSSHLDIVEIARVADMLPRLFPSWSG